MRQYIFLSIISLIFSATLRAQDAKEVQSPAKEDEEINVLFGTRKYSRFVGNASTVKGDELQNYPTTMINEALVGRLPGVFMQQNTGEPGINSFSTYVRGNTGGYIVLINGVERSLTPYDIEQIEEIRVLKDPVSKALYGGVMCNGIIMVTTKTGKSIEESNFRVNFQQGWKMPTVLPKYLNSHDFARKYNEALDNDGILVDGGRYSDEALTAYKEGNKPYQYPDIDFYGDFLQNMMQMTRANADYYGETQKTMYYVHGGYQHEGGLEAYGDKKTEYNSFNMQGNIVTNFSDHITLNSNITGYYGYRQYPGAGFNFSELSSRRPNAYPIFVDKENKKAGGAPGMLNNPYALQTKSGYTHENYIMLQGDLGLKFKLDKLLNGLSFTPVYTFDIYHQQNITKIDRPSIYNASNFDENGIPGTITEIQTEEKSTDQSLGDDELINRWAFAGTLNWNRQLGNHEIDVDGLFYISKKWTSGILDEYKRQNNALRISYTYAGRYTIEGAAVYSGSSSYAPKKRFKTFPALGLGWLLSNESFMKNISWVDFLKLNASWGIQGDGTISANLWRESWASWGTYSFNSSQSTPLPFLLTVSNPNLEWPKMRQIEMSLETGLFNKFSGKVGLFNYHQYDLISQMRNILPSIVGNSYFYPQQNYGKTDLKGMEAELRYSNIFGNLKMNLGAHFTYSKSKRIEIDENPDPFYSNKGTSVDDIRGYRFNGTYTQEEIDQIQAGKSNLPLPLFINSKLLRVGDLKYKNLNGDNVIDRYDTEIIGNSTPRILYGVDANLKYGNSNSGIIELYLLFTGYGAYNRLLDNSYYRIYGTRKYSNVLIDGLPNGKPHPTLSTSSSDNNMQSSDYWIADGSYLRLRSAVFSYSLPQNIIKHLHMKELKVSLYGTNLITFSKIKASDPESLNAGLTQFPLFKTIAIGLSVNY